MAQLCRSKKVWELGCRRFVFLAEHVFEDGQGKSDQPIGLAGVDTDTSAKGNAVDRRRTVSPKEKRKRGNLRDRPSSQEEQRSGWPEKRGRLRQGQDKDVELGGIATDRPNLGLDPHLVLFLLLGADGEPGVAHGRKLLRKDGPQMPVKVFALDQHEAHLKGGRTLRNRLAGMDLSSGALDGGRVRQHDLALEAARDGEDNVIGGEVDLGWVRERGHEGCHADQALLVVDPCPGFRDRVLPLPFLLAQEIVHVEVVAGELSVFGQGLAELPQSVFALHVLGQLPCMTRVSFLNHMDVDRVFLAGSSAGLYVLDQRVVEVVSYDDVTVGDVEPLFGHGRGKDAVELALLELDDGQDLLTVRHFLTVPARLGAATADLSFVSTRA